jgi:hypothetical protein
LRRTNGVDPSFAQQQAIALLLENLNRAVLKNDDAKGDLKNARGLLQTLFNDLHSHQLLVGRSFASVMYMFGDCRMFQEADIYYYRAANVLADDEMDFVTQVHIKQHKGKVENLSWTESIWRAMFSANPRNEDVAKRFIQHPEWHSSLSTQRVVLIKAKFGAIDRSVLDAIVKCEPMFKERDAAFRRGELICMRAERCHDDDVASAIALLSDVHNAQQRAALFCNIAEALWNRDESNAYDRICELFRQHLASETFWQPRALQDNAILWIDLHFSPHIKVPSMIALFAMPHLMDSFASMTRKTTTVTTWRIVSGGGKHTVGSKSSSSLSTSTSSTSTLASSSASRNDIGKRSMTDWILLLMKTGTLSSMKSRECESGWCSRHCGQC